MPRRPVAFRAGRKPARWGVTVHSVIKLFLPEKTLEEWTISEKADIKDGRLVVTETQENYPVEPAVRFTSLVTGDDGKKLLKKVKTSRQLGELGAEHMSDSVILGDDAYDVIPGYLTEVPSPAAPAAKKKPQAETDLLAQFLLNKL